MEQLYKHRNSAKSHISSLIYCENTYSCCCYPKVIGNYRINITIGDLNRKGILLHINEKVINKYVFEREKFWFRNELRNSWNIANLSYQAELKLQLRAEVAWFSTNPATTHQSTHPAILRNSKTLGTLNQERLLPRGPFLQVVANHHGSFWMFDD